MEQPNYANLGDRLLDALDYPYNPGSKDKDASVRAAESLDNDKIRDIHRSIMNIIGKGKITEQIIDELWDRNNQIKYTGMLLCKHYHAHATYIRPRVTELLKQGLIKDSGIRRDTFGGHSSKVWIRI